MSLTIAESYRPGAIGAITQMHARYYGAHWGFGLFFEAMVASELAAFFSRFNDRTDRIWLALSGEEIVGSLIVDGGEPEAAEFGAQVRLFFLEEAYQGQGVGREMMGRAVAFCDGFPYQRSYLTTFEGLAHARRIYDASGYRLVTTQRDRTWGVEVKEQLFERLRPAAS
jgi:GNAT superfamily N-acetyltransferase